MMPKNCPERISGWIAKMVKSSGAKGIVLGMSGGLDSSVAAVLCRMALGRNVLGLIMPCHSNQGDSIHALLLAKKFRIKTETIDLTETYGTLLKTLPEGNRVPLANIKPRLRMLTLYYFANLKRYLVVGTGNKSEILLGYATKHGDSASDMLPLGGLYKTQVRELARELGIPGEIMDKSPSAGLWPGQTDEGEMGIPYEELDRILMALENGNVKGLDPDKLQRVRAMIGKSRHKREVPAVCSL